MNNILVTKATMPSYEEYIEEIKSIWDTHWMTNNGEKYWALRKYLTEYLSVKDIELFTNGHLAIEMALQAFDLQGEVITTPFTFASTTHAIVRNNLTPVFCDINEEDYTIDVNKIEELITDRTCAIMPVHVYGNICDVEAIDKIAKNHNLKVIYDAAHAFGEKLDGIGVGEFGDVSCFSFHATKVYNTIEGGAACFKEESVGEKLRQLRNFGITDEEHVDGVGANAKMNEFQAAMGLCNLRHLDENVQLRKNIVEQYYSRLKETAGIKIDLPNDRLKSNYSYMPILIDESVFGKSRDYVYEKLMENNIFARKYFYPLTSDFDCYNGKFSGESTPVARKISGQVLTLPLYPQLESRVVDKICDIIINCSSC